MEFERFCSFLGLPLQAHYGSITHLNA